MQTQIKISLSSLNLRESFPSYFQPLFDIKFTPQLTQQILILFLIIGMGVFLAFLILIYIKWKKILSEKYVILEIKPPSVNLQPAFSTRQLFNIFHSLEQETSLIERFLKINKPVSYEIVSTKEEGIRYLLYAPSKDIPIISKNIRAYLPSVEIKEVGDYIPSTFETLQKTHYSFTEFKLSKSYSYPLLEQDALNQYDPIAYITAHMTKLEKNEMIALQVVSTPVTPRFHGNILEHIGILNKRILEGKEIVSKIDSSLSNSIFMLLSVFISFVFYLVYEVVKSVFDWFADFFMSPKKTYYQPASLMPSAKKETIIELSPKQKLIQDAVEKKINQNLFEISIRLFIIGSSKVNISLRNKGISSSFATFNNPGFQSIKAKYNFPLRHKIIEKWKYLKLKHRLLSIFDNPILSTSELSSIYHFPYTLTTHTEDLQAVKSIRPIGKDYQ